MSDDLYRLCEKLCFVPAATLAGLRDGSLVAMPREPTEAMIRAYRVAMAPDRVQGFQYDGALVIRDVWREPKDQELWRGPADPVEPGKRFSVGPLHDAFMERCADEKVRLGLRAMLAAAVARAARGGE